MGQCLGFVLKTVLVIQGCFSVLLSSAYAVPRPFPVLALPCQGVSRGWANGWEGTQLGKPTDQRGIPDPVASCLAIKGEEGGGKWTEGGGKRGGGREGCSRWWHLSSQVTRDGALLSCWWLNACLPMGNSEWIPCFALPSRAAFALPVKLPESQPSSFLTFTLLTFSPVPLGESERAARWVWAAHRG